MIIRSYWEPGYGWNAEYSPTQYDEGGSIKGWQQVVPKWIDKWLDDVYDSTNPSPKDEP